MSHIGCDAHDACEQGPCRQAAPATAREILDGYQRLTNRHGVNARQGEAWLEQHITQALDAAVAQRERDLLHEVNRVFCGGYSSILGLEHMRDMHARIVADAAVAPLRDALVMAGHSRLCGLIIGDATLCSECRLNKAAKARGQG